MKKNYSVIQDEQNDELFHSPMRVRVVISQIIIIIIVIMIVMTMKVQVYRHADELENQPLSSIHLCISVNLLSFDF